ncbi:N-acetyl-D-Glu racemase DgcA [Limoniibacter endophyticus]|uniref:Dipeptide epimerase n=1 Tax=Limoniibacter endophyticus TaxID=1565040 RepID=A0A8J3GEV0_9HYPH|nr:N-acetyl-D-Glu racemase DgcA [Limoniibacter endophyticus]GHC62692.1 dipeptide epimerase [Limoniibacter endophyticus]
MKRDISVAIERFPIAGHFTIARGSRTEATVIVATIRMDGSVGRGECVPYARYGESLESVAEQVQNVRAAVQDGATRKDLLTLLPAGAARNAVDCALWDLEARRSGISVADTLGVRLSPLTTAFTLSLDTAEAMAAKTRANAQRPLLKIKLGSENDAARMEAISKAAPNARLIIDANEGWNADNIEENFAAAARFRVDLIEQPLPAGKDDLLTQIKRPVPICADESVHGDEDLDGLLGKYDFVNIKLDKTGGLTAALKVKAAAQQHGFGLMIGCMVGSSLAMAPALYLAQDAEFVDLDGPLLLARDRDGGLRYEGSTIFPPDTLWG